MHCTIKLFTAGLIYNDFGFALTTTSSHSSKKERLQLEIGLLLLYSTTNLQHYSLHVGIQISAIGILFCSQFLNKPQI